jgi:hypothetical protein
MGRLGEETHTALLPKRKIQDYLDVGTMDGSKILSAHAEFTLCVEPSKEFILNVPTPCFHGDGLLLGKYLKTGSFDLISCLDMIEHLKKDDGWNLIGALERLCKGRLIFFTPLGEIWLGTDKKEFHTHLSGWMPEDFKKLGYSCWVFPDCHGAFGAFYAVKDFVGEIEKPVLNWIKNWWE